MTWWWWHEDHNNMKIYNAHNMSAWLNLMTARWLRTNDDETTYQWRWWDHVPMTMRPRTNDDVPVLRDTCELVGTTQFWVRHSTNNEHNQTWTWLVTRLTSALSMPLTIPRTTITDALIIGRLSAVLPIVGISQLVHWYRSIVVYTISKYKFLFLLPKVNKHESGFHFR